jgi:3-oxoacyl-[acyl-carrier-protein] synthase III
MGLNVIRSVRVSRTRSYPPDRVATNQEPEQRLPTSDRWIHLYLKH